MSPKCSCRKVLHRPWACLSMTASLPTRAPASPVVLAVLLAGAQQNGGSCASAVWALQAGEIFSGVQARLGHSTPAAALRYQHAASGADARIAKGLDAMRTTTAQAAPQEIQAGASSAS